MIASLSSNDPPLVSRYRREMSEATLGDLLAAMGERARLLSPAIALDVPLARLRLLILHS